MSYVYLKNVVKKRVSEYYSSILILFSPFIIDSV